MSLKTLFAVAFVIVLLLGGWFIVSYNGIVSAQEAVNAQWSQVENQYQRRADLIPNLVETVKASATHEEKILDDVIKYQNQWNNATTQEEKIAAAKELDSAFKNLEQSFPALQAQLEGTENRISVERMRYKDKVETYNSMIKGMPTMIIANMFGFKPKAYFEAETGAQDVPKVDFNQPGATASPTSTAITNASVKLYGVNTDVEVGEDVILKLSAVNLITKPVMTLQLILSPPSGMSVTSSDFVVSGAGQYTSTYKIESGGLRDIEINLKTTQTGDFNVEGRVIYYFGDDKSTAEDYTLNLPIKVRAKKPI